MKGDSEEGEEEQGKVPGGTLVESMAVGVFEAAVAPKLFFQDPRSYQAPDAAGKNTNRVSSVEQRAYFEEASNQID